MAIYNYIGIDRTGKEVKASITSDNINIAKQKVKSMGIMLIKIKEAKSGKSSSNPTITFGTGISVGDLAIMTRQLATLIRAKIPVVEALSALMDQVENPSMRLILSEVRQKVTEGTSLAKALSDYPRVFNTVYVNMVEAGEASGTLEIVLLRLADFTESQLKLRNKIRSAMTYPVIMAIFGFVMMNVLFIFVIPKIARIFESMKKELPIQTKISIGISNFLLHYWWVALIAMFLIYYFTKKYLQSKRGKQVWHKWQLKTPILGSLVKMINVARFCSTLGTLLKSGVPILTALNIVKNLIPNVHMRESIEKSREAVQEGASIAEPMIESGLYPPLVTHMIQLGEKSGELESMLYIVSDNYQDQVDSKIAGLTSILEPLMMICLCIALAFIVMSIIVPMMQMSSI